MLNINNPGNIRNSSTAYIGEVTPSKNKSFKTFLTMEFGYRAMFKLLNTYITEHKLETIEKMINRYAPPFENNTSNYVKFVCDKTGFSKDKKFTKSHPDLIHLVFAMSWIENGVKPSLRQVEIGYDMINIQSVEEGLNIIKENNNL